MNLFWQIFKRAFQQQLTYRASTLAGLATNFFFGILRIAVLTALYQGQETVNGLSLPGAIAYVIISQAMISFLFIFGSWEVMGSVYSGSIGSDLLKPMHLMLLWMARDLGRSAVNLFGRGILLVALYLPFYTFSLPQHPLQWLGLLLALALGWLVSFVWRFLVNLAAFWTPDARGFGRIAFATSQLLAGFIMPLRLYPDWFARFCHFTPFPAQFNTTIEIYLGLLSGEQAALALLHQVLWLAALTGLSLLVLSLGVRRLVIQGG